MSSPAAEENSSRQHPLQTVVQWSGEPRMEVRRCCSRKPLQ
ncbi:MAG: hypothetical protein ACKPHU_27920 [Planctomycetaceae bacterium]